MIRHSTTPESPIAAATHADPYPYYARLVRQQPMYFDAGLDLWVVSSARLARAALTSPELLVRPSGEIVPRSIAGTPIEGVFRNLARMNDGANHRAIRPSVDRTVGAVCHHAVAAAANEVAAGDTDLARVMDDPGTLDEFVLTYPVQVIARLAGCPLGELPRVAKQIDAFVAALRPGASLDDIQVGIIATANLIDQFDLHCPHAPLQIDEKNARDRSTAIANMIGLLMQTYEATAGLIGNALIHLRERGDWASTVDPRYMRELARWDSPVQNTRRYVVRDCRIDNHHLRLGDEVLIVLAAANRDTSEVPDADQFNPDRASGQSLSYGLGEHGCPGAELSLAVACAAVEAVRARFEAWGTLPEHVGYLPRTNVRIPRFAA